MTSPQIDKSQFLSAALMQNLANYNEGHEHDT